jgi:hypothetical protein
MDSRKDIKDKVKKVEELTKCIYGLLFLSEARFLYYAAKEGPGKYYKSIIIGSLCGR